MATLAKQRKRKTEREKCREFLEANGWKNREEYRNGDSFWKNGCIGIDITDDGRMVFIGESGDFLERPTDKYTLIGVLLEYRQLPINYNS